MNTITAADLSTHLYKFSDDKMQGRMTGEAGQKMAAEYLKNFYIAQGIAAPKDVEEYFQVIPASYLKRLKEPKDSENVLAFIEGSEKPDEIIILSAHYDHVGMEDGEIYNGADDDGSGTVALLEIAEAFQKAVKNGQGPKRSILFLHVTGEEIGLFGSKYYTENPIFPLANTVCNLNTDMIGRIDPDKASNPNYIYLIGSDKLSQELHDLSEDVAQTYSDLELDYKFNDENDPNRFYYRSDHYNFAKNNIPIIFYFNGVHEDYHKPTDTPDKIEYELMEKRTHLIFQTAWEVANREVRITADKL
jgi:Zn-dependent M28 family amino/carboxypeptidase